MTKFGYLFTLLLMSLGNLQASVVWSNPGQLTPTRSLVATNSKGRTVVASVNTECNEIEVADYSYLSDELKAAERLVPCSPSACLYEVKLLDDDSLFLLYEDPKSKTFHAAKYDRANHFCSDFWVASSENISNLELNSDASGNAMLTWIYFDGYHHQVQAAYFSSTQAGWLPSQSLSDPGLDSPSKHFIFGEEGNGVLCWNYSQDTGDKNEIQGIKALFFDAQAAEWEDKPFFKDATANNRCVKPHVLVNEKGNVFLCWENTNRYFDTTTIQYVFYERSSQQTSHKRDLPLEGAIVDFSLSCQDGEIFLICHSVVSNVAALHSIRLKEDASDASHVYEEIPIPFHKIGEYKLTVGPSGHLTLLIANNERLEVAQFNRRWETIAIFERQKTPRMINIQFDERGNTLLTWQKEKTTHYSRGNFLLPPDDFKARMVEKRFATRRVHLVKLTWKDPLSPSITKFKIQKNDREPIELPADCLVYVDPYPPVGHVVYRISSINDQGMESASREIVIQ